MAKALLTDSGHYNGWKVNTAIFLYLFFYFRKLFHEKRVITALDIPIFIFIPGIVSRETKCEQRIPIKDGFNWSLCYMFMCNLRARMGFLWQMYVSCGRKRVKSYIFASVTPFAFASDVMNNETVHCLIKYSMPIIYRRFAHGINFIWWYAVGPDHVTWRMLWQMLFRVGGEASFR